METVANSIRYLFGQKNWKDKDLKHLTNVEENKELSHIHIQTLEGKLTLKELGQERENVKTLGIDGSLILREGLGNLKAFPLILREGLGKAFPLSPYLFMLCAGI